MNSNINNINSTTPIAVIVHTKSITSSFNPKCTYISLLNLSRMLFIHSITFTMAIELAHTDLSLHNKQLHRLRVESAVDILGQHAVVRRAALHVTVVHTVEGKQEELQQISKTLMMNCTNTDCCSNLPSTATRSIKKAHY